MNAKTEILLYRIFWIAERIAQPTIRNAMTSFGEWSYRNGLAKRIEWLESQGYLETEQNRNRMDRVIRLTESGRLVAMGGANPEEKWNRRWDGKWRVVIFDIPESERARREALRRLLRSAGFGGLQRSGWVSPDPVESMAKALRDCLADCGVILAVEGPCCLGENPLDVVSAAWDFGKVEAIYAKWEQHAGILRDDPSAGDLAWVVRERRLWRDCMAVDPLLPRELWPENYPGEKAWKSRIQLLRKLGKTSRP